MTEKQLIQGCINNDRNTQKELYQKYSRQMYIICLRYCKRTDLASDALQKAFIQVFKNIRSFDHRTQIGAWIRKIVVNESLKQLRVEKRFFSEEIDMAENKMEYSTEPLEMDNYNYDKILSLLHKLPIGYKTIFSMYILDDLKHSEIASMLNISESNSRSQLLRARKKLLELVKLDNHLSTEYAQKLKNLSV